MRNRLFFTVLCALLLLSAPLRRGAADGLFAAPFSMAAYEDADASPTARDEDAAESAPPSAEPSEPAPTPTDKDAEEADEKKREAEHAAALRHSPATGVYVADAHDLSLCFFARNEHKRIPPASTTKILSALLILENADLDDVVVAPKEATSIGGTNTVMGLMKKEPVRVEDLLYGMMLVSGNDAATALAMHVDGTIEAFTERMNERVKALGMEDTYFSNPSGNNRGGNESTAYDMALLTQEAMQNETFRTIVATPTHTVPSNAVRPKPLVLKNRNRLVADAPGKGCHYEYAIGVKTGTTALGGNLVAAARKEDVTILCVQLGALEGENAERAELLCRSAKRMFEYVFRYEYRYVTAELLGEVLQRVTVENARITDPAGGELSVSARGLDRITAFRPVREIEALAFGDAAFTVSYEIEAVAPIEAGQAVGTATFSYNGRVWFAVPLLAERSVEAFDPADLITPTPEPTEAPQVSQPSAASTMPSTVEPAPTASPDESKAAFWAAFPYLVFALGAAGACIGLWAVRKKQAKRPKE